MVSEFPPVVFLDIDGVLNSVEYNRSLRRRWDRGSSFAAERIDPLAVALLNRLCDEAEAVVVISSNWRTCHALPHLDGFLRERGFTGVCVGETPDLWTHNGGLPVSSGRHEEILAWGAGAWLEGRPSGSPWVVLDDTPSLFAGASDAFMAHVVFTDPAVGLSLGDVELALRILKEV